MSAPIPDPRDLIPEPGQRVNVWTAGAVGPPPVPGEKRFGWILKPNPDPAAPGPARKLGRADIVSVTAAGALALVATAEYYPEQQLPGGPPVPTGAYWNYLYVTP